MIAKLQNLGPFHFFFTLSCAEKRWPENAHAILVIENLLGPDVNFSYNYDCKSEHGDNQLLIDETPWRDYMVEHSINFKESEVMRKHVLVLTRNFDHRVKMFFKHIVMTDNRMPVLYYSYKVEFQMRGAGHIHGVLWMNMNALKRDSSGNIMFAENHVGKSVPVRMFEKIAVILHKIKEQIDTSDSEKEHLCQFIDQFVSVDRYNPEVSHIVDKVNVHVHTKTCKKYGSKSCRFNFPRFPTEETIIAVPVDVAELTDRKGVPLPEERRAKVWKSHEKIRLKVKKVLEDDEKVADILAHNESEQIDRMCKLAKVKKNRYYAALRYSQHSYTVHYKRRVSEIFVNTYNPEWLKAWDGNLDFQVCLDYFAIITYITDYVNKSDNQLVQNITKTLKNNMNQSCRDRMLLAKESFLTHRQVGQSELFYRTIPGLHLKESNVTALFLNTGFPQNRSRFLKKISDSEPSSHTNLVEVEGRDGFYTEAQSPIAKYIRRPAALEKMCLMQFVLAYQPLYTKPKKCVFKNQVSEELATETEEDKYNPRRYENVCKYLVLPHDVGDLLPKYIKLSDSSLNAKKEQLLSLRKHALVVRLHQHSKTTDLHQFIYSQLLLYRPFRDEEELHYDDQEKCANLYLNTIDPSLPTDVNLMKTKIMPHIESVDEGREKALHIIEDCTGAILDPAFEQNNREDAETGITEDPEFLALHDENLYKPPKRKYSYPKIELPPQLTDLCTTTRCLDREQQWVLQEGINYCVRLVTARESNDNPPEAPRVIVHGGAGCGKSFVIKLLSQWAEYILRKQENDPNHPNVLITAFPGVVASQIGGVTLNTGLGFPFGNQYLPLNDQTRDKKIAELQNLQLLIIDEISMVKSDLLYQIHLRLCEVKQNQRLFGGIAVFAFGDLLQLAPVNANWIFAAPRNSDFLTRHLIESLWSTFMVINLVQNHRQGSDRQYAESLNRIRVGEATDEDWETIATRVRPEEHPDIQPDCLYCACTNDEIKKLNSVHINAIQGESVVIKASNFLKGKRAYKPMLTYGERIHKTAFVDSLHLKVGARVMLIHNMDVNDKLANGILGQVEGFIRYNDQQIKYVLVLFDDPTHGAEHRNSLRLWEQYEHVSRDVTPIPRVENQYSLSKGKDSASAQATLHQFPLRVSAAITSHKIQGSTIKEPKQLVLDMRNLRQPAQGYVMLSRVQNLNQLIILEKLPTEKINPNQSALAELKRMDSISLNNNLPCWYDSNSIKIAYFNTRSLRSHALDVQSWQKL